jgi:hypothetical protein
MPTNEAHSLDLEQLAADGSRLRRLFDGAAALLEGDCSPRAVHAVRDTLREATALVATVVENTEGIAARSAEAARNAVGGER